MISPRTQHLLTPRACRAVTPRAGRRASFVRGLAGVLLAIGALAACDDRTQPGPRAVVTNEDDGTVAVIDLRSYELIATIPVGNRPRGLRASRDGRTLYVALSGSPKAGPGVDVSTLPPADRTADGIGVVDLEKRALVRTIPSGQDPEGIDLVGDHLLVVSNEETAEASIVDLVAREVRTRVPVGGEPEGVATAPDGAVWITSEADHHVTVIDPLRGSVVSRIATGQRPRWIAFTPDGAYGLITGESDGSVTVVDARERAEVRRIELPRDGSGASGPRPVGIVVDPGGRHAYVATGRGGSIAVIDIPSWRVSRVIENVGMRPWGLALTRDGRLLTANGPSDDVSVIDPKTGRVVRRVRTGGSPWGVIVL